MFEIGDDLPTLGASAERLSLVRNPDLLDVAQLGRAARPMDLLSYADRDLQPSVFLLVENKRQVLLTVFNWTQESRTRAINLAQLGLRGSYAAKDVFGAEGCCEVSSGTIHLEQPARSVRILKLIDQSIPDSAPGFEVRAPEHLAAGGTAMFEVQAASADEPIVRCHWNFGDGTSADGVRVQHAFTAPGNYAVEVTATGLNSQASHKTQQVAVDGVVSTRFDPSRNRR